MFAHGSAYSPYDRSRGWRSSISCTHTPSLAADKSTLDTLCTRKDPARQQVVAVQLQYFFGTRLVPDRYGPGRMRYPVHMQQLEEAVATGLLDAQRKADGLFKVVDSQNLIRPGQTENDINNTIYALAEQTYGIRRYWHKRIVRGGRNTLAPVMKTLPI